MSETVKHVFQTFMEMPVDFWVKTLIAAGVLFLLFTVVKKAARLGQIATLLLVLFILGVIGYKWVRQRNEPAFMTPIVDFVARFFPQPSSPAPPPAQPGK
ncbi:putative membrane protein YqjE [Ereboglobus sp. PH5-5]|uniref:hypothetical protein n=1 Tax=unclassified Ereboglobus TaxID=2626932 RepID=UPI0024071F78|nr:MULTISPECIES: hypothetical protein [unclassified Ereboglobus]MDF9827460.1 putative membrane protein YqjE [Ereboglobus sp. PH5-10]MDF9834103.1 putative membrane protein YqjE [Ereboglobus sp. PH5-5]